MSVVIGITFWNIWEWQGIKPETYVQETREKEVSYIVLVSFVYFEDLKKMYENTVSSYLND